MKQQATEGNETGLKRVSSSERLARKLKVRINSIVTRYVIEHI